MIDLFVTYFKYLTKSKEKEKVKIQKNRLKYCNFPKKKLHLYIYREKKLNFDLM